MKDVQPRQLLKQLDGGGIGVTITGSVGAPTVVVLGDNWEYIPQNYAGVPIGSVAIANRTYIDLAGYTQDELTTFVQSVSIQEQGSPLFATSSAVGIPLVYTYDFITTRRITTAELSSMGVIVPGFQPSTVDLQEMIYGQHRTYATNAQVAGTYITVNADTLGSGNPSAADRLHWTRVVLINPLIGDEDQSAAVGTFPANLVCQAVTGKEADLVYIERLRRAYTQERA